MDCENRSAVAHPKFRRSSAVVATSRAGHRSRGIRPGRPAPAIGGLATDWLWKKSGNTKFARRLVAIVGMLGCVAFIVPAALTENAYTAVYCLTAAMFFLECTIGPSWAVPMDVGGKYSGTVSGMMNMAGNIGGALSPLVFGFLVQFSSWQAPFIVAAVLLVAGAVVWAFWLDPNGSVVEKAEIKAAETAVAA